ncbi:MAG: hypothetical protein QOJ27_1112 [Sphingomonadales bacterium]|nr:hypothetical protein [Sphingomonadales bacterium]
MRKPGLIAAMLLVSACGRSGDGAAPVESNRIAEAGKAAAPTAHPSAPAPAPPPIPAKPAAAAGACLMQGEERLAVPPLRAVGTEPFWGARIEGRCVAYSTPEAPNGIRIWTRFAPVPGGGGTWTGALGGRRFELRTRRRPGCSDGMSDKVYPIAVDLVVVGERRSGCAEPLQVAP